MENTGESLWKTEEKECVCKESIYMDSNKQLTAQDHKNHLRTLAFWMDPGGGPGNTGLSVGRWGGSMAEQGKSISGSSP